MTAVHRAIAAFRPSDVLPETAVNHVLDGQATLRLGPRAWLQQFAVPAIRELLMFPWVREYALIATGSGATRNWPASARIWRTKACCC